MYHFTRVSFLILFTLVWGNFYTQTIPISQGGTVDVTCGGAPIIFTDSDASGGNYAAGEDYTITFCPDGGNAVFFLIDAMTAGDTWDVGAGDYITIYDGDNTSANILGSISTATDGPVMYYAATVENPSGCLTIQFNSSATSSGGAGWTSQINCGNQWQPFSIELETSPTAMDDQNYTDICQGDSVHFSANGIFPYSDGSGYNQDNNNCYWEWDLGDGTELEGFGLTEVDNSYTDQFGYPIKITVTDTLGLIQIFESSVRVSTTPSFAGVVSQLQDSICLGSTATLVGGIAQNNQATFGVGSIPSSFISGGFLAGQTFLPDGSGASYETSIIIDDFPAGTVFENESDIVAICATIEHSYLGDLDISLTCPDGSTIDLVTQTGGSTNLGIPWATAPVDGESANNTPGVGFEYCWRPDADNGTFADEAGQNSQEFISGDGPGTYTDTQMAEGSYLPIQPISDLIGCPINGEWTITVTDNLGADNGYIFSWGVQFNPLIDPNAETYQPNLIDVYWLDDATIIAGNDTIITVQPIETGNFPYTLLVSDDFGCDYDTTVVVTVVEASSSSAVDPACANQTAIEVLNSAYGGTWSYETDIEGGFASFDTEQAFVNLPGVYTLIYHDLLCQTDDVHIVNFLPQPFVDLPDTMTICEEFPEIITANSGDTGFGDFEYTWIFQGDTMVPGNQVSQEVQEAGVYAINVYDPICDVSFTDIIDISTKPCGIETYNVFTPNGDGENDFFYIQSIHENIYDGSVVQVYNRWGNLLFEETNYKNDWNMDELNDGTYYFVLSVSNGDTHKGSFTVLHE